jgi:hypothetical protein
MRITLQLGEEGLSDRRADLKISSKELTIVHLHLAYPESRNRTGRYMRRHPRHPGEKVNPNEPLRSSDEPKKLPIPAHLEEMYRLGIIPNWSGPVRNNSDTYRLESAMIAVPISDLVANLLRPCFHRSGLERYRLFYFEDEPIDRRDYFCACFFHPSAKAGHLQLRQVRFDTVNDSVLDPYSGQDLLEEGLIWAAAIVPLVIDKEPLSALQIAQNDYDLRQLLGRKAEEPIKYAYKGWFDQWNQRVAEVVAQHEREKKPFATFYHSIIAMDEEGQIHIRQQEGALPELAESLKAEGMIAAGILDSGGSCALYDVWVGNYLNHSWYFREARGAIIVFQLNTKLRIPLDEKSWIHQRKWWQLK